MNLQRFSATMEHGYLTGRAPLPALRSHLETGSGQAQEVSAIVEEHLGAGPDRGRGRLRSAEVLSSVICVWVLGSAA
jgi:hypothetical protein